MCRSVKKYPVCQVLYRGAKRRSNRAVRRYRDIPDGASYRRVFSQWDVTDQWSFCPVKKWIWWKRKHLIWTERWFPSSIDTAIASYLGSSRDGVPYRDDYERMFLRK